MAKYSKKAGEKVERAMKEMKKGSFAVAEVEKKLLILNKPLPLACQKLVKEGQKFPIKDP
jgi:hypothetical protein